MSQNGLSLQVSMILMKMLLIKRRLIMKKVLNLQSLRVEEETKVDSIFSLLSVAGCVWTTLMPMSSASVLLC